MHARLKNIYNMKLNNIFLIVLLLSLLTIACSKDDEQDNVVPQDKFYPLESPYALCLGSNPGGIVFDFVYKGEKAGANNFDYPSVKDLDVDMMIKNVRGHVYPGYEGGGGMPHMRLCQGATAVNYSAVDEACRGHEAYLSLRKTDLPELTFCSDDPSFDISSLARGESGNPLIAELNKEFKDKLVIGNLWKEPAHNDIKGDEIVWIIKTKEGRMVKMIVTQFPATDGEMVKNGYIAMEWDLLD